MTDSKMKTANYTLKIAWMYPDLMSTYGDRGNIMVLKKRCEWRGIKVDVEQIFASTSEKQLAKCDLIFMGGAQDSQQELVVEDLIRKKGDTLLKKIENNTPGLYICGAYQFLGKYYLTADNKKLPGLDIFPLYTQNPGSKSKRLIGNIRFSSNMEDIKQEVIGFENHGGRTYLENKKLAFGRVIKGFGNNGQDETEGIMYKNSIGTYLHGPMLPKNPQIADFLISQALLQKYKKKIELAKLDDEVEENAREQILSLRFS